MTEPAAPLPQPPARRHGCLTAVMIIVGLVLLLPGLCAIIFTVTSLRELARDGSLMALVLVSFAVGVGGVFLLRAAVKGRRET